MKQKFKIESMTGHGFARIESNGIFCTIEISAINSKGFDFIFHTDERISLYEPKLRAAVQKKLKRGRINLTIKTNLAEKFKKIKINNSLLNEYQNAIKNIFPEFVLDNNNIMNLLKLSEIIQIDEQYIDDKFIDKIIFTTLNNAIDNCIKMRIDEGKNIAQKLNKDLNEISHFLHIIKKNKNNIKNKYNSEFKNKLPEFIKHIENEDIEKRLLFEAGLFAEKIDISEEITRLESHIIQFKEICSNSDSEKGKKINFLMQEFLRETNTIASKSNDITITKAAIELKNLIEIIREQVLNIL